MTKLSCCILTRDDASTLRACLESIRPHVDELVIVDTGSSDDSPAIGREFADRWELYLECNDEQGRIADFAQARNYSFSLATSDWILWLDADDTIRGGEHLRALCDEATAANHTWLVPYEYARDAAGNVTCLQLRERLMRPRHALVWQSPVHEFCGYRDGTPGSYATVATDRVVIEHRSYLSKKQREPNRNLRILKNHVDRVGESDVRALYYLGIEYAMAQDIGQSLRFLQRYVELANWDDEKCKALLTIGEHYRNFGDHNTAVKWTTRALTTKSWPEPYFALGRSYYAMAQRGERPDYNYRRAAFFMARGLELPTDVVLFADPMERYRIHEFLNVCYRAVGDLDKAIWSCEEGLKGFPQSDMLRHNLRDHTHAKLRSQVVTAADTLARDGAISEAQATLIRATLKGELSLEMAPSAPAELAPLKLEPQRPEPGKLDIALFLGPALERWSPETWAKGGMGGSETMAWEMARRLRKLGHRVRFYADTTPAMEGVFEGVEWVQWQRFKAVECDVLIASRFPWAVDDVVTVQDVPIGGCKYKAALLWVHDCHVGDALTMRRLQRFDRILCLSGWHKSFFRSVYAPGGTSIIPESKVIVTRNGIDLARFEGSEKRNPHRAVYSSSPDRGLLALVQMWPRIREQVPDAELHCFYGFGNWQKSAEMAGDQAQLSEIAHLKQLCRSTPGVVMRDRVNQRELAREFMRAGVWTYSTWFSETSCCHPDTRISVPGNHSDGTPTVRIADLVGKSGFPVYAFNEAENRFQLATCKRVWETKVAEEMVALELDSGETLRLTPEHLVLTFDGDWVEAGSLQPGDSLRALHYRYNVAIRDGNGRWTDEHRLVGEWKEGRRLRKDEHVDHADLRRLDNRPEMLTVMTAAEHFSKTHKGKRLSRKHVEKKAAIMKATLAALSPEEKTRRGRNANEKMWARVRAMSPAERSAWEAARVAKRKESIGRKKEADPTYGERLRATCAANAAKGHAAQREWAPADPEAAQAQCQRISKAANDDRLGKNHKVVSVTRIPGSPVYDMEVEGLHNFVADGVVVHNCVTAMEAQSAGLYIVSSALAALNETVEDRGILLDWESDSKMPTAEYQEQFVAAVVDAMREAEVCEAQRSMEYARSHFSLDTLADEWDRMLTELHAERLESPVAKFEERAAE